MSAAGPPSVSCRVVRLRHMMSWDETTGILIFLLLMDSVRSNEKTGEMGMRKITHPQGNQQNSNSLISKFTGAWIAASQVPELQHLVKPDPQVQSTQNNAPLPPSPPPFSYDYGYDDLEGHENWPYAVRRYLADRGFGITSKKRPY